MVCPGCGHADGDGETWPTLCSDGDVCWPCDCPECGESFPPTYYGEPITIEEAHAREGAARSAAHYG